jgi:hypothetical protein
MNQNISELQQLWSELEFTSVAKELSHFVACPISTTRMLCPSPIPHLDSEVRLDISPRSGELSNKKARLS